MSDKRERFLRDKAAHGEFRAIENLVLATMGKSVPGEEDVPLEAQDVPSATKEPPTLTETAVYFDELRSVWTTLRRLSDRLLALEDAKKLQDAQADPGLRQEIDLLDARLRHLEKDLPPLNVADLGPITQHRLDNDKPLPPLSRPSPDQGPELTDKPVVLP